MGKQGNPSLCAVDFGHDGGLCQGENVVFRQSGAPSLSQHRFPLGSQTIARCDSDPVPAQNHRGGRFPKVVMA
jgi:hypothetical protein